MAEFINNQRAQKFYKSRRTTLERDFKVLYRFEARNIQWMSYHFLGEEKGERRRGALRNFDKMKIFLRYIGDPGFQAGVGEDIDVHQSTVSKVIMEILNKIIAKKYIWIKFPENNEDIQVEKRKWQEKYSFPCCVGVIDCTHVRIKKPHIYGDEYINRKGYPSINVQATCNSEELFTSVDASWPGSVHDSRIWNNSAVKNIATAFFQNNQAVLLGDEGYAITPWLMTPFRNPATPLERAYNNLFKRERVIIERCFGQLKQRFPILQYGVRLSLEKIPKLIMCFFILHNVAKFLKDELDEDELLIDGEEEILTAPEDADGNLRQMGRQKRNEIARIIYGRI